MATANTARRRPSRPAFTMLEILTVLLVIGMLIGVLLPAVQSARERARRMSCGNNLAQIGFAFQSYHSAFDVMPAGTISEVLPVENYPNGYHHSWLVRLLPFMDRQAMAREVDWAVSCYDPANWPVAVAQLSVFACPTDTAYNYQPASSNYAGVYDGRARPLDAESRGMLIANRFLARDDVPDGFAYTLLAGEKWVDDDSGTDLGWMSGTRATLRTTGYELLGVEDRLRDFQQTDRYSTSFSEPDVTYRPYGKYVGDAEFDPAVDFEDLEEEFDGDGMSYWDGSAEAFDWDEPIDALDGERSGPHMTSFPVPPPRDERTEPSGFSSLHTGGINMLWADGRVGLVATSVDAEVFSQMGIRDDAMPIEPIE